MEDGSSVLIEAEGSIEKLEAFLKWCKEGPSFASVEKVESSIGSELQKYKDFKID
jgi:acylphosphatase